MLVFSTSWNAFRYTTAKDMLFEIKELGFSELELSFNLTSSMVEEIASLLIPMGLKVITVHNFCPCPEILERQKALPDCFSLSSLQKEERELAIRFTKRTIDTAYSLGAKGVVLHCGRVEIEDCTKELIRLWESKEDQTQFLKLQEDLIARRKSRAQRHLESLFSSLDEISLYAQKKNVFLGVENRFYYSEIPTFEEIGIILNKYKDRNIFYWHDVGHAVVMQRLGFVEKEDDFLKAYSSFMVGAHLHNIIGCRDHQSLKKGEIDFLKFRPYFKKSLLKVLEVHSFVEVKDIVEDKKFIEKNFCDS